MSSWLIGPVIIGTIVGKFLDQRYDTKPWLFLVSLAIAFSLSSFGIVKTVKDTLEELGQNNIKDGQENKDQTPPDTL